MMELKGIQFLTLCLAVCISVGYARAPKKIVNGQNATDGQFPHQVSLQEKYTKFHFCGGSIITETHILTAAHCVVYDNYTLRRPEDIIVITGVNDKRVQDKSNTFRVSKVIPHKSYTANPPRNDIAILKLNRKIRFDDVQRPIRLPSEDITTEVKVTASGWGDTNSLGNEPVYLRQLEMKTFTQDECRWAFSTGKIGSEHICAGSASGTGLCHGDSGGPLILNNTIIGITLFGSAGCATGVPDVFTRVYKFLKWINDEIEKTS